MSSAGRKGTKTGTTMATGTKSTKTRNHDEPLRGHERHEDRNHDGNRQEGHEGAGTTMCRSAGTKGTKTGTAMATGTKSTKTRNHDEPLRGHERHEDRNHDGNRHEGHEGAGTTMCRSAGT